MGAQERASVVYLPYTPLTHRLLGPQMGAQERASVVSSGALRRVERLVRLAAHKLARLTAQADQVPCFPLAHSFPLAHVLCCRP